MNELSLPDQCLVHRYLYYVLFKPVISDQQYDQLESQAVKVAPPEHQINFCGSSLEES